MEKRSIAKSATLFPGNRNRTSSLSFDNRVFPLSRAKYDIKVHHNQLLLDRYSARNINLLLRRNLCML